MFNVKGIFTDSPHSPVFIAAEIGINHEGKEDFAKRLIESARESGAGLARSTRR